MISNKQIVIKNFTLQLRVTRIFKTKKGLPNMRQALVEN